MLLLKGDCVKLFGRKFKVYILEDQDTDNKIIGITGGDKMIKFTYDKISHVTRNGTIVYNAEE